MQDNSNNKDDISAEDLTTWLLANYSTEPENPELTPQTVNMDNWLSVEDFEPSRVTMKEIFEGGLNGFGIILENVFTRRECQRIIEETEKIGYGNLGDGKTGKAYRGNCRLQIDDSGGQMGREIWRRISPFIPQTEELPGEGSYEYLEMNSRYRFAKYFAGQGFALHVDKPTVFEHEKCSILTVNIYLNDLTPEQGGTTRFFRRMTGGKPVAKAGGVAGSIAIFKQSVVDYSPVHDGEKVNSGLKYLMRTDVIYKKL
jgi:prolyl 4-hydroxylase